MWYVLSINIPLGGGAGGGGRGAGGGGGAGCGKTYRLWVLDQYLGVDEPLRV